MLLCLQAVCPGKSKSCDWWGGAGMNGTPPHTPKALNETNLLSIIN